MIIRDFGVRQGRKAFGATASACIRALSTQSQAPPPAATTVIDPSKLVTTSAAPQTAQTPSIFTKKARASSTRKKATETNTMVEDYHNSKQLRKSIGNLGTKLTKTYAPGYLLQNPPSIKDVTLELLMASQAHMGHHTSQWNPANARYIYGIREGIHIISLEETAAHLRRAARVVEEVAYHGGLILFVGTRPGQGQIVTQAAEMSKGCHLFTKWTPGTITNSDKIMKNRGRIELVDKNDQPVTGMDQYYIDPPALVPDLVVCLNPLENYVLLHESSLVNVPTIGVVDTNTEPTLVTYQIPANDDSLRCAAVIGGVLGRAGEAGHKRRLEEAATTGECLWDTPFGVEMVRNKIKGERSQGRGRKDRAAAHPKDNDSGEQPSLADVTAAGEDTVTGEAASALKAKMEVEEEQ